MQNNYEFEKELSKMSYMNSNIFTKEEKEVLKQALKEHFANKLKEKLNE